MFIQVVNPARRMSCVETGKPASVKQIGINVFCICHMTLPTSYICNQGYPANLHACSGTRLGTGDRCCLMYWVHSFLHNVSMTMQK
jgi:hypothetical protein